MSDIDRVRESCDRVALGFKAVAQTLTPFNNVLETGPAMREAGKALREFGEELEKYFSQTAVKGFFG